MTWLRVLLSRLVSRLRRDRWEADLDEELRFHVQMEIDRNLARGLTPGEARRDAMRRLGGLESTKETYRDQKGLPMIDMLIQDVRYSLRVLVKDRAFTLVAVVTLALGIGANTAIFSVVNGVLLEPLPFAGADRIVTVWEDFTAQGGPEQEWIEVPNFFEWKTETDLFETMVAFGSRSTNLTGRGEAQRLTEFGVSYDFFATFAVAPALGRDFAPADDQPGAAPVVILSDGFWQREFSRDPLVLGHTLLLNGAPATVVGVAPPEFEFAGAPAIDVYSPLRLDPSIATRGNFFLQGLARLQPGVSVEQAESRLDAMMEQIGAEFPENRGVRIQLIPLLDQLVAPVRVALFVLLGIVGFVLLIACANVANLLLSRSATRARELAIRAAIGAGRGRLVRQLLTESLVLSLSGAGLGVLLAAWGTTALVARIPAAAVPRLDTVAIDGTVLAFTVVVAVAAGLLFGLAPVAQAHRGDVNGALKEGGRGSQDTAGGNRLRGVLASGQVALALCLLIASGLTVRSFAALMDVDPGFEADGVTTAFISMPATSFAGGPELVGFIDQLVERIEARPGVESAGAVSVLPMAGSDSDTSFEIEGRPEPSVPGNEPIVWFRRATPGYFRTLQIPLVSGREFSADDRPNAPRVVMISDAAAERFWPGEDALGKRVAFGDDTWHTIIGITQGVRHTGLSQAPRPELYFPFAQRPGRAMNLVVKSAQSDASVAGLLRADLADIDPDLPLSDITSMASLTAASATQPRFVMNLTAAFGLLALVLAAVGVYGAMSYTVSRRTTEMGLRMALGASRAQVLGIIVSQGIRLTLAGIGAGLLLAYWATAYLAAVLYDVDPRDVVTFASAPVVLALIALIACLVPALRATRIDPITALRVD